MKVLMICGSPNKEGCTFTALSEVSKELHAGGIETEMIYAGGEPLYGCTGCGVCRATGRCAVEDGVNHAIGLMAGCDGLIIGSPVYFASANGALLAFLDRLFYAAGRTFAQRPGACVVSARRAGTTAAIDRLNKYFLYSQMPIVTSQYWNMVHGNTPQEVAQDLEGLQIMRTLGRNMVWMLKCIESGKKAGVPLPEQEKRQNTNFIR